MVERYVSVQWWKYPLIVLGLAVLPAVLLAAVGLFGITLFFLIAWFNLGGGYLILFGLIAGALTAVTAWLCAVLRQARVHVASIKRMILGGGHIVVALFTAFLCWPADAELAKANWSLAGMVMLYGVWLIIDAYTEGEDLEVVETAQS